MKGKLFKLYDHGQLISPVLVCDEEVEIFNHEIYKTVYATCDGVQFILTNAEIHTIAPNGLRIRGVERIDNTYYAQDWYLELTSLY